MQLALDLLSVVVQVRPGTAAACFAAIDHLSLNPQFRKPFLHFQDHPILKIHAEERANIPLLCRTPLSKLQLTFSGDLKHRWNNWTQLESTGGQSAEDRLLDLKAVLLNPRPEDWPWTPDFWDAAHDLMDLLRYSEIPELRRAATDQLIACIGMTRPHSWEPLRMVLDFASRTRSPPPTLATSMWDDSGYISPSLATVLGYSAYISDITAPLPLDSSFDRQFNIPGSGKYMEEEFGLQYMRHQAALLNLEESRSPTWFSHLEQIIEAPEEDELDGVDFDALEAGATADTAAIAAA
ncbi:hypothetical protein C8F04DRAFT_1258326 [Mycena alexandri]|uniref:Uncharacterized protein n=1 Tax=Mycena alexandri TaxID=1745969 RepID=A0AAD6T008_9AGAR|nr:hypothetical protein C8F04DRAFT_1258326 [Mycena alexandri]